MVHLLTFRASVDAHQQKLTSELEITYCQNETKASEAINGIEAPPHSGTLQYQGHLCNCYERGRGTCLASTREAEATATTTVREAEAARAVQTSKLQQNHLETMRALEDEALKEERHSHKSFLRAC